MARLVLERKPIDYKSALLYTQKSIDMSPHFRNKILKADLYLKTGKTEEGQGLKDKALDMAENFDWYYYGLSLYLLDNDREESLKILTLNEELNPNNWVTYLALGEFYLKDGNQQKVVENFQKAYEFAPEAALDYARYMYLSNKLIFEQSSTH